MDTVGVLTQYQPLRLNTHIGIGIPWDLDRNVGGVTVLPPYEKSSKTEWYTGTANAIYQNLNYMETYNPEYVLILSGDHIYKMDYEVMLDFTKQQRRCNDCSYACSYGRSKPFWYRCHRRKQRHYRFPGKAGRRKEQSCIHGISIFSSWKALREL